MVSSVSFGKIYNIGDKTVVGGGQSGIDSEALITGLTTAKRLPAVTLENKQKKNKEISTAFGELQTLLTSFRSSADALRKAPTIGTQDGNAFEYRTSSVQTSFGGSGETYVSATVASGATVQSYTINEVTALAKAKKQQTEQFTLTGVGESVVSATPGAGQFGVGDITINGKVISLADGDSLQAVSDKFNAVKNDTGIATSILQTAPGKYTLIFTATKTGLSADFDMASVTDPDGALANVNFTTTQIAQNAKFKIDDTEIERESNQVNDLIEGVTLNLKQTTPVGMEIDFDIVPDTETLKTALTNFVDAYNNLRIFMSKQTATNADGTMAETAILGNNQAMRSVINNLTTELSASALGIADGQLNKLADIGITFMDYEGDAETPKTRNVLTIDTAKLQSALDTNFEQVRNMFEFNVTSDVENFQVFNRTNGLGVSQFTLNLDPTTNTYTATYMEAGGGTNVVNLTATAVNGGGYSLSAPANSPLAGLQMIFTGTTATTGSVTITQGLGDRLYNALNDAVKSDGTITNEASSLKTQNDRLTEEIAKIDEMVERYRDQLVDKFSKLESAMASINTVLQSLDAQAQARNNQ